MEIDKHQEKLKKIYGLDIYDIIPEQYRNDTHRSPSKDFVYKLCTLANVDGAKQIPLSFLRFALTSASKQRRSMISNTVMDRGIIITDIEYAIALLKDSGADVEGFLCADDDATTVEAGKVKSVAKVKKVRSIAELRDKRSMSDPLT